ncbi:BppU family phage baseplate upper protein, partial [Zhenhengia yiwuensis]
MKPKSYSILLDIYKGVLNNNQLIEFTTGDNGQSVLEFVLLEDKITAYNLDGCMVRMVIEGQQQDCTIVDASNGKVKIVLLQSMFSRPGNVMAEIQIYDSSDQTLRLTTPRFQYNVRKSLMNNTTVQADPNYSILQNMILEVSSADEVAKQAKKTAESAMTTANQAESKANQIIDNGNYAKEQGDYAKAEGDRLQGMLTIDGTAQTKFDFIKNQVMKDGLIGSAFCIKTTTTVSCPSLDAKNGTIIVNADFENISFLFDAGLFTLRKKLEWNRYQLSTNPTNPLVETVYGHKCFIVVSLLDGILSMSQTINGVTEIKKCDLKTEGIINSLSMFYGSKLNDASVLVYNRQLTTQEIQHIFQVLNNPESIKELRTTDSEGKTSILKLASDEDHVEMSTGRTLREEYMGVLKTMGKDFT